MFLCTICHESFAKEEGSVYSTPCGHLYHYHCIMPWMLLNNSCPHCRAEVTEDRLIELFFEIDIKAKTLWENKVEEEKNSLKRQIFGPDSLEVDNAQILIEKANESNKLIETEYANNKSKLNELITESNELDKLNQTLKTKKKTLENRLIFKQMDSRALLHNANELQSTNMFTIDQLRSEIANLKAKNPNICRPSTSKEEFIESELFVEETSGIKLPANKFLTGCVFIIVEDKYWFEDYCIDSASTRLVIMQHGGIVEKTYSSKITHCVSLNRNNIIVQRAIEDGKKCVTEYWLIDVLARKQILKPWLAHHIPASYREETGLPCQHLCIGISNFDINQYHRIKAMIEFAGGKVVEKVLHITKVLISNSLIGPMVNEANDISVPVVNVQWLNDKILGTRSGIIDFYDSKYQIFDSPNPFSVNFDMVPELIDPWNTPIFNFDTLNLGKPSVVNSQISLKRKRLTSSDDDSIDNYNDPIDNGNDPTDNDNDPTDNDNVPIDNDNDPIDNAEVEHSNI